MSDDEHTITLFPVGTHFEGPDPIHRVTIMFPDEDSAIVFFEWCRELCLDAEKEG